MWIRFGYAISEQPSLMIDDVAIERVNTFKLHVKNTHIDKITQKANIIACFIMEILII